MPKPFPFARRQKLFIGANRSHGVSKEELKRQSVSDTTKAVITEAFQNIIEKLRQNLIDAKANASRNLAQSIQLEVEESGDNITCRIKIADYYDYVDKGIQGYFSTRDEATEESPYKFKSPFPGYKMQNAIKKWITFKGIFVEYNRKQVRTRKKLAEVAKVRRDMSWALASVIKQEGTKATGFYSRVINDEAIRELQAELSTKLGRQIRLQLAESA